MISKHLRICLALSALTSVGAWAVDGTGPLQVLNNSERLALEYGQRRYRDRLETLNPPERRQLQIRLDQQRQDQRRLQRAQLQKQRALDRKLRIPPPNLTSAHAKRNQQLQIFRAQQRRQQLQFELQRQSWPYPKR